VSHHGQGDDPGQLGHLQAGQALQLGKPRPLGLEVRRQFLEAGEPAVEIGAGLGVRPQVLLVAGDDVAALAGLRVLQGGQDTLGRLQDRVGAGELPAALVEADDVPMGHERVGDQGQEGEGETDRQ
jgi:hypothetical protein